MSKPEPTPADIERLRDASEWVQRLNESNAQALADEWLQWCRADPLNLPAFEQMQGTWDAFSEVRNTTPSSPQAANRFKQRARLMALAASIVLAVGMAGWLALGRPDVQVLDTGVGEQQRSTLADGSYLDLAPDSHITTRFTMARRDVQLERGQAFFTVAHSALRPFVVHVNDLTVTCLGTAFDVRLGPDNTVVTVSEGRVNVASAAATAPSTATETIGAGSGERVTFSKSARRMSVAAVDPKIAGAWRDGTLRFVGESLAEVVGEVNRYSAPQIVVAPAFQQTRFTGTISPKNVRDWLKALEQIYAVQVVDEGANEILIRSRTDNGTRN